MNSTSNWQPDGADAQPDDDPRLVHAAQEYLAAVEAGRRPDRKEFAARHADLFPALAPYLDAVDMLHGAPPPHPRPLSGVGKAIRAEEPPVPARAPAAAAP